MGETTVHRGKTTGRFCLWVQSSHATKTWTNFPDLCQHSKLYIQNTASQACLQWVEGKTKGLKHSCFWAWHHEPGNSTNQSLACLWSIYLHTLRSRSVDWRITSLKPTISYSLPKDSWEDDGEDEFFFSSGGICVGSLKCHGIRLCQLSVRKVKGGVSSSSCRGGLGDFFRWETLFEVRFPWATGVRKALLLMVKKNRIEHRDGGGSAGGGEGGGGICQDFCWSKLTLNLDRLDPKCLLSKWTQKTALKRIWTRRAEREGNWDFIGLRYWPGHLGLEGS